MFYSELLHLSDLTISHLTVLFGISTIIDLSIIESFLTHSRENHVIINSRLSNLWLPFDLFHFVVMYANKKSSFSHHLISSFSCNLCYILLYYYYLLYLAKLLVKKTCIITTYTTIYYYNYRNFYCCFLTL